MSWHTIDEILDPIFTVGSFAVLVWLLVVVWRLRRDARKGKGSG